MRFLNCLIFILNLILWITFGPRSLAQAQDSYLFIDQIVEVSFPPEEAFFFIDFGDQNIHRYAAILLPPRGDEKLSASSGQWLVGARIPLPENKTSLNFSIILIGVSNQYAFVAPTTWDLTKRKSLAGSIENLREHLLQRKEILRSWNVQLQAQESSLKRLQTDAETIADVNKIISVREEAERVIAATQAIDRDLNSLRDSLKIAKSLPAPKNYSKREAELTQQLTELAAISKQAEGGEFGRRSAAESELQNRLSLLEVTRLDDPDTLKEELHNLQKRRSELEIKFGPVEDPQILPNALPTTEPTAVTKDNSAASNAAVDQEEFPED